MSSISSVNFSFFSSEYSSNQQSQNYDFSFSSSSSSSGGSASASSFVVFDSSGMHGGGYVNTTGGGDAQVDLASANGTLQIDHTGGENVLTTSGDFANPGSFGYQDNGNDFLFWF